MHTTITCGRTLDVSKGKHGLICGGHIRIQDKIYAKKIGSKSETRTDCFMGFDYSYEEKLHSMDLQAQELLHQIFQLDETIAETVQELQKMNQSTNDYQEAMRLQLGRKKERLLQKVKLDELNKSIRQIESMAFSDTKSEVKIINETYPNTVFHVYRKSHKIEEETQGFEAIMEAVNGIIEVLE
jgi:uncharacterized protein (DUF342 family)